VVCGNPRDPSSAYTCIVFTVEGRICRSISEKTVLKRVKKGFNGQ
jgi:hypothetical protein